MRIQSLAAICERWLAVLGPVLGLPIKQYWAQGLLNETSECDGAELKNKGMLSMMMVMVVVVMLMAMVVVMMMSVTAQNLKTKEHLQSIPGISCG